MMDWLAIWGIQQLSGFAFKSILEKIAEELDDLSKDAGKDLIKDVFKDSAKGYLTKFKKDAMGRALIKAYQAFLYLIQQELEAEDLSKPEIDEYNKPLNRFIRNKDVKQWLGAAFNPDGGGAKLKPTILSDIWANLDLKPLPDGFSWKRIAKLYVKRVEDIIGESQELINLFSAKKLQEIAINTQYLSGIIPDFDLERYRESIIESYSILKLSKLDATFYKRGYQISLHDIFIPQTVRETLPPSRYDLPKEVLEKLREEKAIEESFFSLNFEEYQSLFREKPSKSVLDIVNDPNYPYIVFLGDPGSGKSSLLQYLALDWAENPTQRIPLLFELRDYIKDNNHPTDFLDYFHQGKRKICELNQIQLHEQLNTGNALVMFDGLDEIFDNDTYGEVIQEIHTFSNKYPKIKIIVTSRIVGYNPDELSNAEFTHFTLEDFNTVQIREFIKRWYPLALPEESLDSRTDTQKRLQTAVDESPAIRQLAQNPLLLTMMALLNRYKALPRRRIDLYEDATNVLLYQWDIEYHQLDLTIDDVDLRAKQAILRDIAYKMQATDKGLQGNIIYWDVLEDVIADYYYNKLKGTKSRKIAGDIINQLRKRDFILCYLGKDYYGFVHRTFLEYFCAMSFIERFRKRGLEEGLSIEEMKTEVFGQHWEDQTWHEVLRLISGQLGDFIGDIINYLIDLYEENQQVDLLVLAAECLNEVDEKVEVTEVKNRLLEKLKEALESGKAVRKVAKTITKYWENDLVVMEWLEDIALNHQEFKVKQGIAQGIADVKLSYLSDSFYISNIGDIYYYDRQYEKAFDIYKDTDFSLLSDLKLGDTYIQLKKFEEAIEYYNALVTQNPSNTGNYEKLADAYGKSGKYQEAIETYEKAFRLYKINDFSSFYHKGLGGIYWDLGDYNKAIENYKLGLDNNPNNLWKSIFCDCLGIIYYHLGDNETAINYYKQAINLDCNYSIALDHLGALYRNQEEWDKAIQAIRGAIDVNPRSSNAYRNLGLVYLLQGDDSEAKKNFSHAIKLNPYYGYAILTMGIWQALQNDIEGAKITWKRGLKLYGEYAQRHRIYRIPYNIALGETEQGLTTLQDILNKEKPPVGLLNVVLKVAYLLQRCPQITGIDEAITMIEAYNTKPL